MKKAQSVIYCDTKGLEHEALVFATNPFNPSYVSLVYIDESKPDANNRVEKFDVQHMDEIKEANPDLPTYHLNCWKETYAWSKELPPDHPAYDHPHQKTHDEQGQRIPVARPAYDADIEAHQGSQQYAVPMGEITFGSGGTAESTLPPGVGTLWQPGHPTDEDLQALAAAGTDTIEELREEWKAPEGFATFGDFQTALRSGDERARKAAAERSEMKAANKAAEATGESGTANNQN
jgi:hypothetical protein